MHPILSIQSHVSYGYVGNRVATFVLQRLGHEVITINTVQFSNHTGYGRWQGDIYSPEHIANILKGLHELDVMKGLPAILTGYIGSEHLGRLVLKEAHQCQEKNPNFLYVCDPVLGDVGRNLFVPAAVAEFFREEAILQADILTPNLFELAYLTQQAHTDIKTMTDLVQAIRFLQNKGPKIILVTSVHLDSTPDNCIDVFFTDHEEIFQIRTPKLNLPIAPNGAGDAVSALLLGHYLSSHSWREAFEATMAGVFAIFEETAFSGERELQLIAAQDTFTQPKQFFFAEKVCF